MENASKALIMAAEILIGVLLISLFVLIANSLHIFSDAVNDNIETKNISEFNSQFEIYVGRKDLTAQDVVSFVNLAKNYNQSQEVETMKIIVNNKEVNFKDETKAYDFINNNSQTRYYFKSLEYNEQTNRVNNIYLQAITN